MLFKSLYDTLLELINDELLKSKWKNTDKFINIKFLQIDQRGRVGEHFFKIIFEELNLLEKYVDNAHGDWDIEADNLKIEIKTASLDGSKKFQHEGVKESKKWDVIAFLDIAPNSLYITFIHKNDFEFGIEENINGKKKIIGTVLVNGKKQNIHFRGKDNTSERATGAGYKVDFKESDLIKVTTIKDVENLFVGMKNKHINYHEN